MQINSINTNQNQQSFKGIVFHNKAKLAKNCVAALERTLKDSCVKEIIQSKDFNLHIKPSYYSLLNFRIKSANQGIKGFLKNLFAPWIKGVSDISGKQINEYKTKYHPTLKDIINAKAEKKQSTINRKRLEAERIAQLKAIELEEQEQLNKEIQKLIDIEN